jgi:fibro-slime domain-containing protein
MGQACCASGTCQAGTACSSSGSDGVCARCGSLGDICCAGNACNDGCCSGGRCLAVGSPSCPASPPDGGGQPDSPIGGASGTGGAGGTTPPGTGGSGGGVGGSTITPQTGGASGTSTPPGTGGTGGTTTPWTIPVGCGDGVVTFPERCDDGNLMPFDGCSSDCQIEPICSTSGPCTSKCGDGIVLGEDCDDGNTVDGDGCSSACKVEVGFTCTQPPLGDSILVPVVYRDFKFHNPTDFEAGITGQSLASAGVVNADLDSDGKPVFTGLTGTGIHVASTTTFAEWYRNTAGVNHATPSKLALWDNGNGAYVNRYGANGEQWPITEIAFFCGVVGSEISDANGVAIPCTYRFMTGTDCDLALAKGEKLINCIVSDSTYEGIFQISTVDGNPLFFPVDGDTFTPSTELSAAQIPPLYANGATTWAYDVDGAGTKRLHNFSFTSEVRYWFKYDANQTFKLDITGDDDVWVFINKKLAIDLGGVHTPVEGSVTLDSTTATKLGLTSGNVYEVAVFQAERQTTSSTFKITLDGFNTAPSECHPN